MDLSVVIVNFNTKDILRDCLKNILNMEINLEYEIIVVDNGSSDKSAEMVKEEFPNIKLIAGENVGLAKGYNVGLKNSTGRYVLYLGSDAFPQNRTLDGMVSVLDDDQSIGIATCKLVLRNGMLDLDAHRGFPTPWTSISHFIGLGKLFPKSKLFNQYFLGYKDFSKPHEIDLCLSHFMMVRRSIFDYVGLWDEDYFVYGEDVDFCYRTKKVGYKIMYLPMFEAVHYKGASVGTRKETEDISTATKETKIKMSSESIKAMKLFYEKHYKNVYPSFVTFIVLFGIEVLGKIRNANWN
ncbi:glycosyl transferase family 2 [candidate division WWE3 bacterium CG_4_9_14_0_2_um_filter_35_11]|uniref:Glycosyl transferase family 2 n=1 Tax=candidate division WWE3 bacterium CG_4_9_14_0_2_um_filter_35_11 TaxID=1975077 RepID=A0A2M8EME0_UNCKA|nr:MAG: glycosyl transferase family 2 [candidate division WWE3 bacterium CG10_big_fil_rev_8_21_14_0_10_35_32]PJC23902.1 MAG: glycosyl transferase family 2 [candidate division WWE3 bacterium CG_4_9_14_0_2_um_filter_35_11]